MTDIDQAVVEKFGGYGLRCYTCDASGRNVEHTSWKFTRDELREAMIAINLPDLLRKEREYDALLARVEVAPVGRRYEIAVGDWIVTPDEWAEIDMPCKRVRLLVEQEG